MALIFTPGQFSQRAEFYYQLNQLTAAGIGVVGALQQIIRNPPARSYREPSQRVLAELAKGYTFSEALQHTGPWLPEFDITLITAGFIVHREFFSSAHRIAASVTVIGHRKDSETTKA